MHRDIRHDIAALLGLTVAELRQRYAAVFGEPTRCGNKTWLIKRIAWRMQATAYGDLSQRARQRAQELAEGAELRTTIPRSRSVANPCEPPTQDRLPLPGAILTRTYKGRLLQVIVLAQGFEFEGTVYRSLSAVAKAITGSHCSGNLFFGLAQRGKP
jgi:Protein of unknown function (DUF2924)